MMKKGHMMRGINWVPDSDEDASEEATGEYSTQHGIDDGVQDLDDVKFVLDSLAGDTEVPDSQVDIATGQTKDADVIEALLMLANTDDHVFSSHKAIQEIAALMMPIMLPRYYGKYDDEDVNLAATRLHWIAHGF
ncbi:hypothetical protein GUJ93_ZPchr0012g21549 [Zizania palustris]|uniref:Uncharacterized protein n=1 Tax=Zizania palustris TaxID=103762 RepID=A0A8J5VE09_ZIZPA|nr:hypothetical protein GUJ93_ZPchr0003g17277 [Zizania palustris]KAG8092877.1 hypothetical protein GUJ93_ZPchr0012g21549 [Zizania palustris]